MAIVQTLTGRSEHILDGRRRWALSGQRDHFPGGMGAHSGCGVLLRLIHGDHRVWNLDGRHDLIHGGRHD
jgi:hypothetical protein